MKILSFNSKGGVGKSIIAREIIPALNSKQFVIVEIDELNKTQLPYKDNFLDVVELKKSNIEDILIHVNQYDNVVIDVGADNLTLTLDTLINYGIFEDIDRVVIPLCKGRTDAENALKTYKVISQHCSDIIFAFNQFNPEDSIEEQYPVFFSNVEKFGKFTKDMYVTINASDIFLQAQTDKKLVVQLAEDIDYKSAALSSKKEGDDEKFHSLMKQELHKRAAQHLINNCVIPACKKINKK